MQEVVEVHLGPRKEAEVVEVHIQGVVGEAEVLLLGVVAVEVVVGCLRGQAVEEEVEVVADSLQVVEEEGEEVLHPLAVVVEVVLQVQSDLMQSGTPGPGSSPPTL